MVVPSPHPWQQPRPQPYPYHRPHPILPPMPQPYPGGAPPAGVGGAPPAGVGGAPPAGVGGAGAAAAKAPRKKRVVNYTPENLERLLLPGSNGHSCSCERSHDGCHSGFKPHRSAQLTAFPGRGLVMVPAERFKGNCRWKRQIAIKFIGRKWPS